MKALQAGKNVSLPTLSSPDFQMLGRSFEEMREALEGKKYVEQYVQTLTHEIKSPLAGIQAAAELLTEELTSGERDKLLKNISTESVRIKSLVDKMLTLSALQAAPQSNVKSAIFIRDLIEGVCSSLSPIIASKDLKMSVHGECAAPVMGDAFRKLVSNAIDFAPHGDTIKITLDLKEGFLNISVKNSGQPIPDWALPKVCDKFFSLPRPDSNRKSSGIGLAIVKEVAERHGGDVVIQNCNQPPELGVIATLRIRTNAS